MKTCMNSFAYFVLLVDAPSGMPPLQLADGIHRLLEEQRKIALFQLPSRSCFALSTWLLRTPYRFCGSRPRRVVP